MTTVLTRPRRSRRPERFRRVAGSLLEIAVKAYGAAAVASVAFSDAKTVAGKRDDAINAVPNLVDRYRDAKYVAEHRAEIQTALDYANQHTLEPDELEAAAQKSTETLDDIETTYDEAGRAWDAITNPNPFEGVPEAVEHVGKALEARPDLASIGELADLAENAVPFIEHVEVLIPAFYGGVLTLADNFASDEIGGTATVMAVAFAIAYAVGTAIGFWARRGRPGWVHRTLQTSGARVYQDWYVRNLEFAVGTPLYAAARRRTQDDILADPQRALDPDVFRELEQYFARRLDRDPT